MINVSNEREHRKKSISNYMLGSESNLEIV